MPPKKKNTQKKEVKKKASKPAPKAKAATSAKKVEASEDTFTEETEVRHAIRKPGDVKTADKGDKADRADPGGIGHYMNEIRKIPLLDIEQEVELAGRIKKGDEDARRQMIQANLRLVVKIANDYKNFGLPINDLVSEGNIGLVKAVERYDPEKGGKLSTYAAWWIKQSIKRALANQGKTIRLPVHLVGKISRMRKIINKLQEQLKREPTNEEVAALMGISVNKVAHFKSVSVAPSSLDAPVNSSDSEDGSELGDLVSDEEAESPFESLHNKSLNADVDSLLGSLDSRESDIIRLRFGLGKRERPMTLEEVGEHFGITRERVRQLQNSALIKMKKAIMKQEETKSAEDLQKEKMEDQRREVIREFMAESNTPPDD